MPSYSRRRPATRPPLEVPAWLAACALTAIVIVVGILAWRWLWPPSASVQARKGSEGARWADLMKRTGGLGPVGTRPYAPGAGGTQ